MDISFVIPAYNEAENLPELVHSIVEVMGNLHTPQSYEIILVDDGSKDNTEDVARVLHHQYPQLQYVRHSVNLGQSRAFLTGFSRARGDRIITLDADLQNSPFDIPKLLNLCHVSDCVVGKRAKREDVVWKKWLSKIANRCRHVFIKDGVSDTGCSLKIFKRECVQGLPAFRGLHRFFPAYFIMQGYSVSEIEVSHAPRKRGTTKYTFFSRGISVVCDFLATAWLFHRRAPKEKTNSIKTLK